MPASGRGARPFAHALSQLIGSAPDPAQLPSLAPSPPWTAWDHDEGQLWPRPDDSDIDLNAVEGPRWLDEAGQAARNCLQKAPLRAVIGHGDWYAGNLRWVGDRLLVAHDWDSVIADGESVIVGMAAAVFPVHHRGEEPTVDESRQFLDAYAEASGRLLGREEIEQAWAAGVWIRGFDSKKQFAETGTIYSLNEREASERLRRAAAL